jgi:hypothetical protein
MKADLISVIEYDRAVEALEQALLGSDRRNVVQQAVQFLASNDLIDEIYCSDGELTEAIAKVLERHTSGSTEAL